MRTAEAIRKDISRTEFEMRSLAKKVNDKSRNVDISAATLELEAIAKRKNAFKRELAELSRPVSRGTNALRLTNDALIRAAIERRGITIGSAGAINQIREFFKEIVETDNILNFATYYYGPNAATNIPVLSMMDMPDTYDEGAETVAGDTRAGVTVTEIQPATYARYLAVTAEILQMGAVDIESALPDLFSQAFTSRMHEGMLVGAGTGKTMKGIFVSAKDNTAGVTKAAGPTIKITELAALALQVLSKDESYRIIMNPSVYQGILSDATDSEDIKIYKEGLIRDKSIEGVSILLDAKAPTTSTEGSILAVACPLRRYAIGIAGELHIEPIKQLGDTKTYFQATMFFSGKQVSDSDLYSISAGASSE